MSTLVPFYINTNVNGIPALKSLSVDVTSTDVRFDFNNHRNIGSPYRGYITFYLAQSIPTGTTTTLPIVFTSGGANPQPLMTYNGAAVTVGDLQGTGIYLAWFERDTNTLQLISGAI